MKFSHSLKFNAVPEWQDNYVNYPALKKVIYKLQQDQLQVANAPKDGSVPVDNVNRTTVSDLVETYKFKKSARTAAEAEEDDDDDDIIYEDEKQPTSSSRFKKKFINRFKKSSPAIPENASVSGSTTTDLEKAVGSMSSATEMIEDNSKKSSTEAFTVEVDNSTIVSFTSQVLSLIHI